jgi:hypothetical protein
VSERYIVIPKWDELQHYKGVDRPAWIKNYAKLLHDDRYLSLTETQRAVLHGLWLLYAASGRKVPENTSKLSRALSLRVTKPTLEALNHAGFIRFRSRPALEKVYAREEKSREKPKGLSEASYEANGHGIFKVPEEVALRRVQ